MAPGQLTVLNNFSVLRYGPIYTSVPTETPEKCILLTESPCLTCPHWIRVCTAHALHYS